MLERFIEAVFSYQFLQHALITASIIGAVAGALGCFIILRSMSLMGDAISHAVLPGVAISYLLGWNYLIGALIFGILASVLITFLKEHSTLKGDTAIGITFSAFLALGIVLISLARSSTDLSHILFGNVLAVQTTDLGVTLGVSILVLVLLVAFFKELKLTSFDPIFAQSIGIKVAYYHYLLMICLTLVAIMAMRSVGSILIVSLLITPAATAYLFTNSLKHMLLLSSSLGVISSILGIFLGYSFNLPVGPSIVLTATLIFMTAFLISPKQTRFRKKGLKQ